MLKTRTQLWRPALVLTAGALLLATPAVAQDTMEAPDAPAAGEKITLRLKLDKGTRVSLASKTSVSQDFDMGGMPISTTMDLNQEIHYGVVEMLEGGSADLSMRYGRVHGSMDNPMLGAIEFDSAKEGGASDNPMADMIGKMFTAMAGAELTVTMSPRAEISNVRGIDELVQKMMADNPMAGMGGGNEELSKQFEQNVSDLSAALPEEEVGLGSTWSTTKATNMNGMNFEITTKNTVEELTDAAVVVAQEISGKFTGGQGMAAMMDVSEMSGSGTTSFSRTDGLVLSAETSMEMKLSIAAEGQEASGSMSVKNSMSRIDPPDAVTPSTDDGSDAGDGAAPEDSGE